MRILISIVLEILFAFVSLLIDVGKTNRCMSVTQTPCVIPGKSTRASIHVKSMSV